MKKSYSQIDAGIAAYVEKVFRPEDRVLQKVRERARAADLPDIHVGTMDGLHLETFARMMGARKIVEIGTLAGYSGVCLARGLALGGRLYTFEYDQKHAEIARQSFVDAGLIDNVEIHIGKAIDNLSKIEKDGPFDMVFIDADKPSYPAYFEWAVKHLRKGGAILADNTFALGEIASYNMTGSDRIKAIHNFNERCATDPRLRATILPTSDGLTLAIKI